FNFLVSLDFSKPDFLIGFDLTILLIGSDAGEEFLPLLFRKRLSILTLDLGLNFRSEAVLFGCTSLSFCHTLGCNLNLILRLNELIHDLRILLSASVKSRVSSK